MKIETPILKRLGPVPFWRGQVKCLDELQRIYTKAIEAARKTGVTMVSGRNTRRRSGTSAARSATA